MCPEDPLFGWPIFTEEVEGLVKEGRCPDFVASLKQINNDPECRDKLVRFVSGTAIFRPCIYSNLIFLYEMNYGCCAVRLDLGKEIHIRTVQFYNIPGTHSSPEIVGSSHVCLDISHHMAPERSQISPFPGGFGGISDTLFCHVLVIHFTESHYRQPPLSNTIAGTYPPWLLYWRKAQAGLTPNCKAASGAVYSITPHCYGYCFGAVYFALFFFFFLTYLS